MSKAILVVTFMKVSGAVGAAGFRWLPAAAPAAPAPPLHLPRLLPLPPLLLWLVLSQRGRHP
ncbi:MAG: hypothetical protein ACLVES_02315 [Faecalibacterium prausnitzii]